MKNTYKQVLLTAIYGTIYIIFFSYAHVYTEDMKFESIMSIHWLAPAFIFGMTFPFLVFSYFVIKFSINLLKIKSKKINYFILSNIYFFSIYLIGSLPENYKYDFVISSLLILPLSLISMNLENPDVP